MPAHLRPLIKRRIRELAQRYGMVLVPFHNFTPVSSAIAASGSLT